MSAPPAAAEDGKKGGGKRKLIIMALAVLLLVGGGAGAWFSGVLPKLLGRTDPVAEGHGAEPAKAASHDTKPAHGAAKPAHGAAKPEGGGHGTKSETAGNSPFMDLPDIIANLNGGPRRTTFVKLKAKLELAKPEDQAILQAAMPRVLDLFQGYLREMRPEELRGTAGTYRLREELLARTNLAAPPARVVAVLFTEMLIQ